MSRRRAEEYRLLLQDRWTTDVNELVTEFDRVKAALAVYGFRVLGYDPGVLVCDAESSHAESFDMPTWALRRLVKHAETRQ